jgi:hypothetical protein
VIRAAIVLALMQAPVSLVAQSAPVEDEVSRFVLATREATARYQDQQAALRDGYRRIGPDFPSMGEHWINRAVIMRGEVDPLRPPILEYIVVAGKPVLAGVAYAKLVYAGEPSSPIPAPGSAWHYHAGSVDEESFILGHAGGNDGSDSNQGPRIAVLHAWIWQENPAGLFATDNWALPWIRLGLVSPPASATSSPAALAATLAAGGEHYFVTLLRVRHRLAEAQSSAVAAILRRRADQLRRRIELATGQSQQVLQDELTALWEETESELVNTCSVCFLRQVGH